MSAEPVVAFRDLLKEYRLARGLTQEALAERAGVSARNIQSLEGGQNRPLRDTAQRLAGALALGERERALFLGAVLPIPRRRASAAPAAPPLVEPDTALPTGMLAVLVADVRGYTAYTHTHGDEAGARLAARFAELAGEAVTAEGGRVVEVRGDEVLAVFGSARAALRAALGLLARCAQAASAQLPLRAGVGLDVGEPVPVPGGYRGEVINTAARLCALAGPGEVLASEAVVALARRVPGLAYEHRGDLALRGIERPVRTWLVRAGDDADSPPTGAVPPPAPVLPRHNLPPTLTSFIGREQERARARGLLDAHRLVTLVGSGGVGKTRLALAVAEESLPAYADGVWLVELAPLNDPALLPGAVAHVLGLREEPDRPLPRALADHLKDRQLLLVLDNCEHLIPACAELAAALSRAGPAVRLLATSREGLGVAGERRFRVPPLSVPDRVPPGRHPPSLDAVARSEAVRLFVERAQEQRDDFAIGERTAGAVAEICARLDGMPLAIELAAARVGSMPVEDIAARLHDRFRLLSVGARDLPPRQRTLRAALDWSWDLLEDADRALLRRLAVFAGGWTLAAVEAVLGAGAGSAAWEVLDGLASLVSKSLVQVDETGEEAARYRLLETVREYAGERLASDEDAATVHDRHLAWCVALAREAAPRLTGPDQAAWLARLEAEHDNVRAALGWARRQGEAAPLLQLAAALWRFWYLRGYLSEGRTWLAAALSLAADAPPAGEPRAWATALHGAGVLAWTQGEHAQAVTLAEQALVCWRALGEQGSMAPTLNLLGLVALDQGDWARASAALEESLTLHRARQDRWGIATALHNLGTVARRQGDPERAATLYEEGLALRRALGDVAGMAISYLDQGLLAVEQGGSERAVACFRAGLTQAATLGDAVRLAQCVEGLAMVAARQGRAAPATQLLGTAAALRERIQAPIAPAEQAERERLVATLRAAMGPDFEATLAAGRAAPWERLVASAFVDRPAPPTPPMPAG